MISLLYACDIVKNMTNNYETAVFGGGCFWCTEAVFKMLKGVKSVTPGYAGGTADSPSYEQVSSGQTGHAEVIKIEFDPKQIFFKDLLTVFFATHDPTTKNRQGNDVGAQYRSIILYSSGDQKRRAEKFINDINKSSKAGRPVVTELKPLGQFYEAEGYHRDYYKRNPDTSYCQVVINPKLEKVKKEFGRLIKLEP